MRAVAFEFGAFVEHLAEYALHGDDPAPDGHFAAQLFLQIGRGRQVIGMCVRFQNPVDGQACLAHIIDDLVRRFQAGAARGLIEIPDAVDNGCALGLIVADDIGRGKGRLMEEGFDVRRSRIAGKNAVHLCNGLFDIRVVTHTISPMSSLGWGDWPSSGQKMSCSNSRTRCAFGSHTR